MADVATSVAGKPSNDQPDAAHPAGPRPSLAVGAALAGYGPASFNRSRIRAIGLERAPHKDLYHFVLAQSWPRFFLLTALLFLLTNLVFALLYWVVPGSVTHARPGSFEDSFYFSVQTLATIGYGGMTPATRYAHIVVTFEAFVGVLAVALITGITFTRFARPSARVLFANRVVISPRNGVPHVMFRMANWRRNRIVEARLGVVLLVTERTREGEVLRRQIDLPLVRDRTGVFFLTWTAMHRIDEASPFHGPDAMDRLREQGAELFLALIGLDETIGQTIHARRQYSLDDIVWNARFADVLSDDPDGTRVIDFRRFHDVVPIDVSG
ncbi:MAG TPA: ion channel [Polyangia bacterium]|nr:ion channel [Polyangia bacterium]